MKHLNQFLASAVALLFAALFAAPATAQIAFVKTIGTSAPSKNGTSTTITVPAAGVAAGNSVIVSLAMNPSAGAVSCSDTRGNTYTSNQDVTNGSGTSGVRMVVLSAHNIIALTSGNKILCTHPSVTGRALAANQFSGLATTSTVDKAASATGNSTSPLSGITATTAQLSEVLIGAIGVEGPSGDSFTPGANYTTIGRAGTSGGKEADNITINSEYRIVSATGAYAATGTLSSSRRWAAAIVTFKAALPVATKLVITSINSGTNPTAGVGFPVVVQSQSASGTPANVTSATSVALSRKSGTGSLGGTLTGTIAAGSNQVAITGITYTKAESGVVFTATRTSGDNLTAGDSAPFTVVPGEATKIAFSTQPESSTAGSSLSGPPTVVVQDSLGNTVTSSTASITVAIGTNPGGGTLSGTTPKSATAGVASFGDLSIDKAGTGYTLSASASGLIGATSNTLNVTAAAASKLVFTTQPTNATAGSAIDGPPTVTVQDDFGNTVTNFTAAITVAIGTNPGGGTLSGTTTVNANSGVGAFTGLSINQPGNGYTLTALSTGLTGATSNDFNITSGSGGGGTIAGIITRVSNGSTITGALVEAYQGTVVIGNATTNSSGSYSITGLAAGIYTVKASYTGLVPQMLNNVAVAGGSTTPVDLSLNFGIAVQSPVAGTTINDFSVLVTGNFNTSLAPEVGIQVNGYVALQDGDEFATFVPIDSQTTTLTATITDTAGNLLAGDAVPITPQPPSSEPVLTFRPSPGIALVSQPVGFTLTSLNDVFQVQLDGNGDGTIDFTGATLEGVSVTFAAPGLYFPNVTVTATNGTVFMNSAIVQVVDIAQLDVQLIVKWSGMKNALRTGDTAAAASYIVSSKRTDYQNMFNNLTIPFASIDQMLGNITYQTLKGLEIEYEMLMDDGPDGNVSYLVLFSLDSDGVWRISFF